MPPDFLTPVQKKNTIFWKNRFEKNKKNLTVNNNNKIIRAWYLPSK